MLWAQLTSEINGLSVKKGALTELTCFGSPDTAAFVSEAKVLLAASSRVVDTVESSGLEELRSLSRQFSHGTIGFVHAARGFLFDKDDQATKDRFHDASKSLDEKLENLLDMVIVLMEKNPFQTAVSSSSSSSLPASASVSVASKSPRRAAPAPPIHSIASFKESSNNSKQVASSSSSPPPPPPPLPPRRPSLTSEQASEVQAS